jgi:glycosyltransferase involved in cell wall biosynthesis
MIGFLDRPAEGDVVSGPLLDIDGWVIDDALQRIEIVVDGALGLARPLARPRPDVEADTGSPHAILSGYQAVVDIADRRPGDRVVVEAVAVCGGTRHPLGSATVTVGPPPEPAPVDMRDVRRLAATTGRLEAVGRGDHHVLAVTHQLDLGGGQFYLQDLVLGLVARGVRSTVVSPSDGPLRAELEAAGVDVSVLGPYWIDPRGYERTVRDLALLAVELGATAVLANTAGSFCGVDAATRLGLPALWAIHESFSADGFLAAAYGAGVVHPYVADRFRRALAAATAVVFEAEQTRRLYAPYGDSRRFVHVPYGIPLDAVDAYRLRADRAKLRTAYGFRPSDVVLLCVGTIEERKAQGMLVRAFAEVAAGHPEAVLALVGHRGDAYGDIVRRYAEAVGLGRVRIEPMTPDVYDWYALADVFVLASDVESLPRSVLEAMAFELPVLATAIFGLSDTVDEQSGMLVPARDVAALEHGLRRMLDASAPERAAMGAAGARGVRQRHDSRGYVAAYRRLLDGLARDPNALPLPLLLTG